MRKDAGLTRLEMCEVCSYIAENPVVIAQCALCWARVCRDCRVECDQCEKRVCRECYEQGVYDCEVCPQCEKICCSGVNDECALDGGFYHCVHANCHLCDDCVAANAQQRKERSVYADTTTAAATSAAVAHSVK